MIKLFLLMIMVSIVYKFVKWSKHKIQYTNTTKCSRCNGRGFWIGTRGEQNYCKKCDGYGYLH